MLLKFRCNELYNNAKNESWKYQDRQCTFNVTLRRVRVTIVAVENQYVITCSACV